MPSDAQPADPAFRDMAVDHIGFVVADLAAARAWFCDGFGFGVYGGAGSPAAPARTLGIGRNQIRLVCTEPRRADHPDAGYLDRHGDGVADIALRVPDAVAAFAEAVRRGARPVAAPVRHGGIVTASIAGFGDVRHTFVQRRAGTDDRELPGLTLLPAADPARLAGLRLVDHFALCLPAGQVESTVDFYRTVLDFEMIFTELIVVGDQAITTKVVQSRSGAVTLTLIEPDVTRQAGHIDEFLARHGGAGVQHIAFGTDDIVTAVDTIRTRGVEFLHTPPAYYERLPERLELARYSVAELERMKVLVDSDHDGQLFQIFTRSVHPRNTLFFEVIERLGARGFGGGNIKALYEAVELHRGSQTGQPDRDEDAAAA